MVQNYLLKCFCIPLLACLFIGGCGSGGSNSGAGADVTLAQNYTGLFAEATFHPRCVNCHTFNEGNAVSARHEAENRSNRCQTCHTQDDWRASQRDMTTTGKTASEVCITAVNRRGSTAELAELLRTSPHVRWAIEDGSLPNGQVLALAPPGNHALWIQMVNDWVAAGSSCE